MGKSIERHKLYRCYWCSIDLHWRRVKTDEEHGEVVCVGCPICERPVSELEIETVDIDEVFEGQDPKKEGEALIPPKPSWLYYCFDCGRYVPCARAPENSAHAEKNNHPFGGTSTPI